MGCQKEWRLTDLGRISEGNTAHQNRLLRKVYWKHLSVALCVTRGLNLHQFLSSFQFCAWIIWTSSSLWAPCKEAGTKWRQKKVTPWVVVVQCTAFICITSVSLLIKQQYTMKATWSLTRGSHVCAVGQGSGRELPLSLPTQSAHCSPWNKLFSPFLYRSRWYDGGNVRNNKQYCRVCSKAL